ncbi:hypothetical protein [Nocardia carnea]|uniref:Uncharacterized protein n=1 Tax=Nocardia carnea TaxID=37328 RepID=A0ABW7TT26_9NOCA|nr:hypothetical protein [Nocardia carnea]
MNIGGPDPYFGAVTGTTPGGLGKRAGARFVDWIIAGRHDRFAEGTQVVETS